MVLEAAVQGATAEVGDGITQATEHVVQRQQRLLAGVSTVLLGAFGPIGVSAVVVRLRHLATVLAAHSGWQGTGCSLETLGVRLEDAASCGRCREELLP